MIAVEESVECEQFLFLPSGGIPNHPWYPVVIYRGVLTTRGTAAAAQFEQLFQGNSWAGAWRNGVFDYHHFHSNVHEVLGVYLGAARVRFGGPGGRDLKVSSGDVVVIPAGVGHKAISADDEFGVVGAYPDGGAPDLFRDSGVISEEVKRRISMVSCPIFDPVFGSKHGLRELWSSPDAASQSPVDEV